MHLKPCKLLMHYHHLPLGKWWSHASRLVELRHVELPQEIFGRQIKSGAHRADVLRLQLLLAHGGLYLDLDVVVLRTFHGLLRGRKSFLIGREGHPSHGGFHGLCNAVLLARPNASFARRWLDEYHDFGDPRVGDLWSEHSVQRPIKLAAAHPDEVHVLPYNAFFWPDWDEPLLRTLVLERSRLPHVAAATELTPSDRSAAMRPPQHPDPSDGFSAASEDAAEREYAVSDEPPPSYASYAVHLFSSLSTPFVLRQWSLEYLASVPASLNCNIYAALSAPHTSLSWPGPPMPALPWGVSRRCGCDAPTSGRGGPDSAPSGDQKSTALVAHWPLRRPAGSSARHIVDISGRCNHGWIYSSCGGDGTFNDSTEAELEEPGCWRQDSDLPGAPTLSVRSELEAFVPLPPDTLARGKWTVSWRARIDSRRDGCGSRVPFWALQFAGGDVLTALAEAPDGRGDTAAHSAGSGGYLVPLVQWAGRSGGSAFLRSILRVGDRRVKAHGASVCGTGWHHYTLVASARKMELHLDGGLWATAPWQWPRSVAAALASATGADPPVAPPLLGLWIAGEALEVISRHDPSSDAGPGTPEHAVAMADLALFRDAIEPEALPLPLRPTQLAATQLGAPTGSVLRVWPLWTTTTSAAPTQATKACAACRGEVGLPSTDVLPWHRPARALLATPGVDAEQVGDSDDEADFFAEQLEVAMASYRSLLGIAVLVLLLIVARATVRRRRSHSRANALRNAARVHATSAESVASCCRTELSQPGETPFKAR